MRKFLFLTLLLPLIVNFNNNRNSGLLVSGECGVCQRNGVACVGRNEFYICAGARPLTGVKFSCPRATDVCNNATIVCDDEHNYGISCNSCDMIDYSVDKTEFCAQKAAAGFYEDAEYIDCNTFILCYLTDDGQLKGVRKRCPENLYFDSTNQFCYVR